MITRRAFGIGSLALLATPAVVKAAFEPMRVWSSHQSGMMLMVDPLPGELIVGDMITIDGVERWYRGDNTPTRRSRQFVITHRAEPGHRVVSLYPPIIGEHNPRHRTVVELPMNRAQIRLVRA